ncbi:MAG: hypothetical protein LC808_39720 [Actinobacteria bacterium]|nr:hypothetical protein [Actinomycetota bacterium]
MERRVVADGDGQDRSAWGRYRPVARIVVLGPRGPSRPRQKPALFIGSTQLVTVGIWGAGFPVALGEVISGPATWG